MDFSLFGFSGLTELYNVHPAFVHFPIALFPSALFFYFLGAVTKRNSFHLVGRSILYLAVPAGVLAVITGLAAQDSFSHNETIHHMMETHESVGLTIMVLAGIVLVWSFWQVDNVPRRLWPFIAVLAVASYLVLQNGDIGGRMVYVQGAAVRPAIPVISSGESQHHGD
jgi:uncharacterized membrane protein